MFLRISIEGDLYFIGALRVDGTVRGKLSALPGQPATLIVGTSGRVDGNVTVRNLVVHGTLDAVMRLCGKVELASTARLTGHLRYTAIDVSPGAIVEAQLASSESIDQTEAAIPEASLELARLGRT